MSEINRRDFLKVLGWSGATMAIAGCGNTSVESGVENVESYSQPQDFVVPGIGIYYASTCVQCGAGCGITGRVREGHVLKLEGNKESLISKGRLCGLGQAAVQHHYNPDRLQGPLLRQGDSLQPTTWDSALTLLAEKTKGTPGDKFAFLTGPVSGHLKVLLQNYVESLGSKNHFVYDALATKVNQTVSEKLLGAETPVLHIADAQLIVSFGADFIDTWKSSIYFAGQYALFRKATDSKTRGTLVQIEPKMTLTGANADRWVPIRAGTEGVLALGLVNALSQDAKYAKNLPVSLASTVRKYDKATVEQQTGVSAEVFDKIVALLQERTPSLVLSGPSAEGHAHGAQNAAAILLLNVVLGNVGQTITAPAKSPFPQIAPIEGSTVVLNDFNDGLAKGRFQTVFIHDVNPVYTAPAFLNLKDNLKKAAFKVVFTQYLDETAQEADLVLPLDSAIEDWGTHISSYQPEGVQVHMQQPLMEKLYPDTRSFGETLLALLKQREAKSYEQWSDYYAYLKSALIQNKTAFGGGGIKDDEEFWYDTLSHGVLTLPGQEQKLEVNAGAININLPTLDAPDAEFAFQLVPSVRASLRDGRHANLPWLQETPDPLTTIVWDSWVEIHPKTAEKLGIKEGDIIEVTSKSGSVKTQAYLFPGLQPDTVAIPIGQGHEAMGRYAKSTGVNPLKLLDPVYDKTTGELATYATRVKVAKTSDRVKVVKDEGWSPDPINTQQGRKIVVTTAADQVQVFSEE